MPKTLGYEISWSEDVAVDLNFYANQTHKTNTYVHFYQKIKPSAW